MCRFCSFYRPAGRPRGLRCAWGEACVNSRSASTLVELLVAIAIIGVLIAILLPAVQSARESARLAQCKNNLKNIGLGLLSYHDVHKQFPGGGWGHYWVGVPERGDGRGQPGGWIYAVLPFVEEGNLHDLGIGATGNAAIEQLNRLETKLGDTPQTKYWHDQMEISKGIVTAWTTLASGKKEDALNQMKTAADLEDATTKNPVSPGSLLPARELLGDMYMQLNQPAEALAAYEKSLENNPNRYNTYYGAALAAEKMKDMKKAKDYYEKLIALKGEHPSNRESLEHAKKVVAEI